MNRYLRIAGLVLALTPLAYPYGNLLEAVEAAGKTPNGVRYHTLVMIWPIVSRLLDRSFSIANYSHTIY